MATLSIPRRGSAALAGLVLLAAAVPAATASQTPATAVDQAALLYEINRARWNPTEFRGRANDITMPASVLPAPPLAPNPALVSSASFKANELADHGYFAHRSAVTGIWPNRLARLHGYPLLPTLGDDVNNIESLHGGSPDPFRVLVSFANSPSHRRHLFGEGWFGTHREVGIGRSGSQNFWAVHTGITSPSRLFVTGFVYDDVDGNGVMDRGEGMSGVTVTVGGASTTTDAGGAYAVRITPGTHRITFSGGGLSRSVSTTFTATSYNVDVEYVHGDARPVVRAYELCDGLPPTILGTDGDDVLYANPGRPDVIHGLGGNDIIIGVGPEDVVCLGTGNATIVNGSGSADRLAGATRFETAVAVSQAMYPDGADVVYLATGGNYPDTLAAGPAASARGAPLLLAQRDSVPASTAAELRRLDPSRVFVLGGAEAVSSQVLTRVRSLLPSARVTRLAGETRYETAVAVSRASFGPGVDTVYVATGVDFPDALAAAPAAYAAGGPLLLVRPDGVPAAVRAELTRLAPRRIVIVGSNAAVEPSVAADLRRFAPTVQRISGSNRYTTSVAVSRATYPGGAATVYVAVGTDFPDALTGGSALHADPGPVLLVRTDSIPAAVRAEISRLAPGRVVVLGGSAAVSPAVQVELAGLVD